jgi:hypothetical protein
MKKKASPRAKGTFPFLETPTRTGEITFPPIWHSDFHPDGVSETPTGWTPNWHSEIGWFYGKAKAAHVFVRKAV